MRTSTHATPERHCPDARRPSAPQGMSERNHRVGSNKGKWFECMRFPTILVCSVERRGAACTQASLPKQANEWGKTMNYDTTLDAPRNAELNRHLDSRSMTALEEISRDREEQDRAEQKAERERHDRIDAALSEVLDVNRCYVGGTLDYDAAAGVLTEYLPEVIDGLRLLLDDPRKEIERLRREVERLTLAVALFKAAKRAA